MQPESIFIQSSRMINQGLRNAGDYQEMKQSLVMPFCKHCNSPCIIETSITSSILLSKGTSTVNNIFGQAVKETIFTVLQIFHFNSYTAVGF